MSRLRNLFWGALGLFFIGLTPEAGAQPGGCHALFSEVRTASRRLGGEAAALEAFLGQARTARACYEAAASDSAALLLDYETYALIELRRYDEAEEAFSAFFSALPSEPLANSDSTLLARMYQRAGLGALHAGRFVQAQQRYARASRYAPALAPHWEAFLYLGQANALAQIFDFEGALRRYEAAEALLVPLMSDGDSRHLLGQVHWNKADILALLATWETPSRLELFAEAAQDARAALELLADGSHETKRHRAFARLVLGDALLGLGRPEEAIAEMDEAVRAAVELGEPRLGAQAWRDFGRALEKAGRPQEALDAFGRGLDIAEGHGERYEMQYLLLNAGEAHEALGQMQQAEAHYRRALALAEDHRAALGTTEWSTAAFANWQGSHRRLVGLLLRQGRTEEAFLTLDATRARYLRDLRRTGHLRSEAGAEERARLDSLDAQVAALRSALFETAEEGSQRLRLQAHLTELEAERGQLFHADEGPAPTLAELQRALAPRGQALITYFLENLRDHEEGGAFAFVVRPDTFLVLPLAASREAIRAEIDAISPLWTQPAAAPGREAIAFETAPLARLYEMLFAPLAPHLEPGTPLVIVPDEPLSELPFGMLLEHAVPRHAYTDAPFLLRRHPLSTELAAALLLEPAPERPPLALEMAALGVSTFSGEIGLTRLRQALDELPDLPAVAEEISALRRLFGRGVFALDEEATEPLLYRLLPEARLLHLASHAVVYPDLPLYNAILLTPGGGEDGLLHLYELAGQRLHAELVVLSGCSTARGRIRAGEGMMGLQHGFRAAGARAALAMLWPVDDQATVFLMERFYRHLRRGLPKDEALQHAQLDYLGAHGGLAASPFFWAAPALYGDTAPLDTPGRRLPWVLAGLALVLAGLALPRLCERRKGGGERAE